MTIRVQLAGVTALAVLCAVPGATAFGGERPATLTGVMQIDTSGIDSELKQIRAEVVKLEEQLADLNEKLADLEKAVTEMSKSVTEAVQSLTPPAWEYKLYRGKSEKEMNNLGAQGWEIIGEYDADLVLRRARLDAGTAE